jgi:translation initiation factor eIF-2B subunit delta
VPDFRDRAAAIAADRQLGASELAGALLPVAAEAIEHGRDAVIETARIVCAGQPAMAPLWNVCAAALAEFASPGRFERVRAELERAPRALERAAALALRDAFAGDRPRVLTLSYSASVARTLITLAPQSAFTVVCAESLPGREGKRLHDALVGAGIKSELVLDSTLTTYLSPDAAVVVGADAVASRHWTNRAGTFGLSAAAWFSGVPVYLVVSRDKAQAAALADRMAAPPLFERTPIDLATLVLTDAGPVAPDQVGRFTERYSTDIAELLLLIR